MTEEEEKNALSQILSEEEVEDIQNYVREKSEKVSGQTMMESIEKYGMGNIVAIGVSVDILSQATGRVASVLATMTGQGDTIVERISQSMREHIDSFEKYVGENMNEDMKDVVQEEG